MKEEMNSFVNELVAATKLHKHEGNYFFFGRMGHNYSSYPFNWEPFRDLAGSSLRSSDSMPIVLVSNDTEPPRPIVQQVRSPRPHYQILISPACKLVDIVNTWLETLVDDGAIPQDGGAQTFQQLKIPPEDLSSKARNFINMLAA